MSEDWIPLRERGKKPKGVRCKQCNKGTTNDVAKLCDECLKEVGQMTVEGVIRDVEEKGK